jgi:hypothetical protein
LTALRNRHDRWCGPCVAEVSERIHLYEAYRDRGIEILG